MNFIKTLLILTTASAIVFSGCKKDEEPVIEYPITLSYQSTVDDSGIKAYEKQSGALVEISAAAYESDPDYQIADVDKFDRVVLLSETTAELYADATNKYDATYTSVDGVYKFNYTEPILMINATHTMNGSTSKLNSLGVITGFISNGGSLIRSGLCGEINGSVFLPCLDAEALTGSYSADLDDGEILVLRTFEFVYE